MGGLAKELGRKIRQATKEKGLSQDVLARSVAWIEAT